MFKKIIKLSFLVAFLFILTACSQEVSLNDKNKDELIADRVEVFYFHSNYRCFSCVAIDEFTKKTIFQYFREELNSGRVIFEEVNVDLPENREVVSKFQARGSGLYINAIYGDENIIEEDLQVWRLLNDETRFKNYLRNKLNKLLGK